jgi:DNA-binding GntR family transcriptional regulator
MITRMSDVSLTDELLEEIQRRIVTGEIPVGSWLRHATLAESFGVSRTPVREVLRVLESRGIVEIVRNRGARVKGPSPRDLRELGDIRAVLEGHAAGLAATRIRDSELRALREAWQEHRAAIDRFVNGEVDEYESRPGSERWVAANQQFHAVIQTAAGNRQLRAAIDDFHRRLPRNITYGALSGDSRLLLSNVKEHDSITEAIAAGDSLAAREAMDTHVRRSTELIVDWFERQQHLSGA